MIESNGAAATASALDQSRYRLASRRLFVSRRRRARIILLLPGARRRARYH